MQHIYHILVFIRIPFSVQGKHNEPHWKLTLITEWRNWHTTANMSRKRENEKHIHMPSSPRTVTRPPALLSQSKCSDKESLCVPCSNRATQKGEVRGSSLQRRKKQSKSAPPSKILQPSPTAWQDITAELCWVGELRLCYWWLYRPQISITQTQSLSRDMATDSAIEGVRQFALCHQSNQPTHIHTHRCACITSIATCAAQQL